MRRAFAPTVVLLALVASLALVVLTTVPSSANDNPSSRVAGKAGTLAAYDWLTALGFNTHRISDQFTLGGTDVLVMVEPTFAVTTADAAAVIRLLSEGGDLVLAVSPASAPLAQPLLTSLHISLDIARVAGGSVPAQPFDAGDRVRRVPMAAGLGIAPAATLTPLLVQGTTITVAAERVHGAGRAYVVSSPFPFSNDGLRDADSAPLLLSLIERARGGAIAFDEYHHGEQSSSANGVSAIFDSPLGLALLLAMAAVIVHLGVSGRRLGPPVAAGDAGLVPSTATYINAMAGLYARSGDRRAVAARYAEELKRRIGRSIGVDPTADDGSFTIAAAAFRPDLEPRLRAVLLRAGTLSAASPDANALLSLARDVDELERQWSEPVPDAVATAQWRP
jgi:hypothetical protein